MKTSKHTKGPWKFSGRQMHEDFYLVEEENGMWNIARVEGEANARLIAAAPDLLEAAEFALNFLTVDKMAYNKLKEAINKAKGESK